MCNTKRGYLEGNGSEEEGIWGKEIWIKGNAKRRESGCKRT